MSCHLQVLVCFLVAIHLTNATHFRGAIIQWRPVDRDNFDGRVEFVYRIAWRINYNRNQLPSYLTCDPSLSTFFLATSSDVLRCRSGCGQPPVTTNDCSAPQLGNLNFNCSDRDSESVVGRGVIPWTFPTRGNFEAQFCGGNWVPLERGGNEGWDLRVRGNLTRRPDGRINTSPIALVRPVFKLQQGCGDVIRIPVQDADGDEVRCRMADSTMGECGSICNAFPNSELDQNTCILSYNGTATGRFGVAIQVEDFISPSSQTPLSSVPVQFLIEVVSISTQCDSRPILVGVTPADHSIVQVSPGVQYIASLIASSQSQSHSIRTFLTESPLGLALSSVSQSTSDDQLYFVNVTWTPTPDQFGQEIFCFSAENDVGQSTERRCITFNVSDVDECSTGADNCDPNANCTNIPGSFRCTCNEGYTGNGITCDDTDECEGGIDNCGVNATCVNSPGSFFCTCNQQGFIWNGMTCEDVNECMDGTDNCDSNATCTNTYGGFTCTCNQGYSGNGTVCVDIDECALGTARCLPTAICTNSNGSYLCFCPQGYSGDGVSMCRRIPRRGLTPGQKTGIALGVIAFIFLVLICCCLIIVCIVCVTNRRRRHKEYITKEPVQKYADEEKCVDQKPSADHDPSVTIY